MAAGVLRSGVIPVGSEVPCHPYHCLISFGVQWSQTKSVADGDFLHVDSELLCFVSWCQCRI